MPWACPGSPEVRAKIKSCVARCTPVLNRLEPLITQSSPSDMACVSSQVASEPCSGSVSPNAIERSPVISASDHAARCSSVPNRSIMMTCGKLPTIEDSFCRSLCSPRPLCARCSRMTAMSRLVPSRPPSDAGQPVAQPAGLVGPPAHLGEQVLPLPRRDAVVVPVGAGVFAALVEELHVLGLQRGDLALDERVHVGEQPRKVFGQREIHGDLLLRQPYRVFFHTVARVAMASSSLISMPRPGGRTGRRTPW